MQIHGEEYAQAAFYFIIPSKERSDSLTVLYVLGICFLQYCHCSLVSPRFMYPPSSGTAPRARPLTPRQDTSGRLPPESALSRMDHGLSKTNHFKSKMVRSLRDATQGFDDLTRRGKPPLFTEGLPTSCMNHRCYANIYLCGIVLALIATDPRMRRHCHG